MSRTGWGRPRSARAAQSSLRPASASSLRPSGVRPSPAPVKRGPAPGPRPAKAVPRKPIRRPVLVEAPPKPTRVQIEGAAMLTLMQHASQGSVDSKSVAGSLCGSLSDSVVYITNCFPVVGRESLRKTVVDVKSRAQYETFIVGWYRSVRKGLFIVEKTLMHQRKMQKENPGSVCLIYDPASVAQGRLSLKAFRLSDKFMTFLDTEELSSAKISELKLDSRKMIEMVPIHIHNSHLTHALLFELRGAVSGKASRAARRLKHESHESQLLESLRQLTNSIDDFEMQTSAVRSHHSKCMRVKKQREAKVEEYQEKVRTLESRGKKARPMDDLSKTIPRDPAPPRLESMTLIGQMNEYADAFDSSILQGLSKLFVAQGLHSSGPLVP